MYRYPFAVHEDAHCVWEYDLPERNLRFLVHLDPQYFDFRVRCQVEAEGQDAQYQAILLRTTYHHATETLFSLLGALSQAPGCVPAWLMKCRTDQLRSVVRLLLDGATILTQAGPQHLSLEDLSSVVHQWAWQNEVPTGATSQRFATLWRRLAEEFLDEATIAEYNSLKHGFRVSAGGFGLSIGQEPAFGIPAPPEEMEVVGYSPFGTSFYRAEIVPEGTARTNRSFRIRNMSLNWSAEAMIQRIQLIVFSLNNVIGALRCLNGTPPETVSFNRPEDPDGFEAAWNWHLGVTAINLDTIIDPGHVQVTTREGLIAELVARGEGPQS